VARSIPKPEPDNETVRVGVVSCVPEGQPGLPESHSVLYFQIKLTTRLQKLMDCWRNYFWDGKKNCEILCVNAWNGTLNCDATMQDLCFGGHGVSYPLHPPAHLHKHGSANSYGHSLRRC